MKTVPEDSEGPLKLGPSPAWTGDRAVPENVVHNSGQWADAKIGDRLLDQLLRCLSGSSVSGNPAQGSVVIPPDFCDAATALLDMSAPMRGLVFSACSRRITDMMATSDTPRGQGSIWHH